MTRSEHARRRSSVTRRRCKVRVNPAGRFLVVGNPIAHSRSPDIHRAFAAQFDLTIDYDKALVPMGEFAAFVSGFAAAGGRGLNVTVPFKGEAFELVDSASELAAAAAAVNTIKVEEDGRLSGFNTDGIGLVNDLSRLGFALEGARVLLLGAGGAARGVALPLLRAGIAELVVANRTLDRAQALVAAHRDLAPSISMAAVDFASVSQPADIVINATSTGLQERQLPLPPTAVAGARCYDMSYGQAAGFARWAGQHGAAATADGLGMLVEQAAESFHIWLGRRPATAPVLTMLRRLLDVA